MLKRFFEYFVVLLIASTLSSLSILYHYNPVVRYLSDADVYIFTAYNGTTIDIAGDVESVNSIIHNDLINFSNKPFTFECNTKYYITSDNIKFGLWRYEGIFKKSFCTLRSSGPVTVSLFTHHQSGPVRVLHFNTLTGAIIASLPLLIGIWGGCIYMMSLIKSKPIQEDDL